MKKELLQYKERSQSVRRLNQQLEIKLKQRSDQMDKLKKEYKCEDVDSLKDKLSLLESDNIQLSKCLRQLVEQNGENQQMVNYRKQNEELQERLKELSKMNIDLSNQVYQLQYGKTRQETFGDEDLLGLKPLKLELPLGLNDKWI